MDRNELLNDNQETFRQSFKGAQTKIWTSLPAIVVSVDFERQTISAQSSISGQITNSDGSVSPVNMPIFDDVVLCFPRAGGYAITFPVQPGDEVLIMFASRCIDEWWQSGGENNIPPESRIHDLSDSFAILAPTSQPKAIANISPDYLRIMNEQSTKYIEISDVKITINSDEDILIESSKNVEINTTENVNITATENVNITATENVSIEATENVSIEATENVNIDSAEKINLTSATSINLTAPDIFLNGIVHP